MKINDISFMTSDKTLLNFYNLSTGESSIDINGNNLINFSSFELKSILKIVLKILDGEDI